MNNDKFRHDFNSNNRPKSLESEHKRLDGVIVTQDVAHTWNVQIGH